MWAVSPRCGISSCVVEPMREHTVFGNEKYCIMKVMRRNGAGLTQRTVLLIAFFLSSLLLFIPQVQAKEYSLDSAIINAVVQPDGSMEVTEQRVYDFQDDFKFVYEYLYHRPDQALDPHRSEPYQIRVKSVCDELECYSFLPADEVNLEERRENPPSTFTVVQDDEQTYIQWHFSANFEPKTFTVSYIVDNAITLHENVAELYWQFIGDEWEISQ